MTSIINFHVTGLTAQADYNPPSGYYWRPVSFQVELSTGAGAGSRSASIVRYSGAGLGATPTVYCQTGSQAGTNTNYYAFFTETAVTPPSATSYTAEIRPLPLNGGYDRIRVLVTLIAGDTVAIYATVEEDAI